MLCAGLPRPPAGLTAAEAAPQSAAIRVYLPPGARLTIDGAATAQTSGTRLFASPPLEGDRDFHYTLTAEFTRRGEAVTVRKVVPVRAGRETVVSLGVPEPAADAMAVPAAGRAPVREAHPEDELPRRVSPASEQDPLQNAGFQHSG
jgi:uncharacterized protein (TIGR03000 family)